MGPSNTSFLLLEEPIRLGSILEQSHYHRSLTCLTKIVGTVGGNSRTPEALAALLKAGMTAARFDFSSGDLAYHQETLANLKEAMHTTGKLCTVMCDMAGPELTIPNAGGEPVALELGSRLTLRSPASAAEALACPDATREIMWLSVPGMAQAVKVGGHIFVGQYLFTGSETTSAWLKVAEIQGQDIVCEVTNSATLCGAFFTVHISQARVPAPALLDSDKARLREWLARGCLCDVVTVSFARQAAEILEARAFLESLGAKNAGQIQIYAKIENMEGLLNFDGILREADGIILGRGNLGIDLPAEKVFLCQKEAIQRCNLAGKPVVISRVVDSMTDTPRPTRAEATDVANAVLDGVDAIMLGAETLRGLYPVETVATLCRICGEAEKVFDQPKYFRRVLNSAPEPMSELESMCSAAVTTAENLHAACLVVFTATGKTARLVAKYKPTMPAIVLVIPNLVTNQLSWTFSGDTQARQACAVRGLFPVLGESGTMAELSTEATNESVLRSAIQKGRVQGLLRARDRVVVVQKMKHSWVVRVVDA